MSQTACATTYAGRADSPTRALPVVTDEYEQTLAQLEAAFQLRHVAHRPLTTIRAEATPAEAGSLAAALTLSNLPVGARDGAVIGVLENLNARPVRRSVTGL